VTITKAVIPAAGLGTRLYPATKSQPKEMLPLGTRPTIQFVAEELVGAGLHQLLIVTGRQKRAIEDHFDPADGLHPENKCERCAEIFDTSKVHFFYIRQSSPRGLGDAVAHAEDFTSSDHFVVALGDCVITSPGRSDLLKRMVQTHSEMGAAATIAVQRVSPEATRKYGIVAPVGPADGPYVKLQDLVEKPGPDKAPSNLAVCARYVFSPAVFDYLRQTAPGHGGEVQLTDAIRGMVTAGLPVYAVPLAQGEARLDVGDFPSYARAFMEVMLKHPEYGPGLREFAHKFLGTLEAS
jgi:UTP--glucose-1-phosphate uridylyltransferase